MLEFRVLVLGDRGVGKTSFVRCNVSFFSESCSPSTGVEVQRVRFDTQRGWMAFRTFDVPGPGHEDEPCFAEAQAALVLFQVPSISSVDDALERAAHWVRVVRRRCGAVPLVLCRSKADEGPPLDSAALQAVGSFVFDVTRQPLRDRRCRASCFCLSLCVRRRVGRDMARLLGLHLWQTRRDRAWGPDCTEYAVEFVESSAKTSACPEEPFELLTRKLVADEELRFVFTPAITPVEVRLSGDWEAELALARDGQLLDYDDDL